MKKEKTIKEKIQEKISNKKSKWLDEAKYAEENEAWLEKSAQIALKILRHLRENKISQVELSRRLGVSAQYVSKIVKGRENLSLETICKIEAALEITLIEVIVYGSTINVSGKYLKNNRGISRHEARSVYNGKMVYTSFGKYSDNSKKERIA